MNNRLLINFTTESPVSSILLVDYKVYILDFDTFGMKRKIYSYMLYKAQIKLYSKINLKY